jgi:hypothetical protein
LRLPHDEEEDTDQKQRGQQEAERSQGSMYWTRTVLLSSPIVSFWTVPSWISAATAEKSLFVVESLSLTTRNQSAITATIRTSQIALLRKRRMSPMHGPPASPCFLDFVTYPEGAAFPEV